MVIIWLTMVNNNLVGGAKTILKNMSLSMGRIIPCIMENKKMFETTNQSWNFSMIHGDLGWDFDMLLYVP